MSEDAHDSDNAPDFDAMRLHVMQRLRELGIIQEKRDGACYRILYQAPTQSWLRRATIGSVIYDQVITHVYASTCEAAWLVTRLEANAFMASDGAWADAVPCWKQNNVPEFSTLDCDLMQRALGVILDESRLTLP